MSESQQLLFSCHQQRERKRLSASSCLLLSTFAFDHHISYALIDTENLADFEISVDYLYSKAALLTLSAQCRVRQYNPFNRFYLTPRSETLPLACSNSSWVEAINFEKKNFCQHRHLFFPVQAYHISLHCSLQAFSYMQQADYLMLAPGQQTLKCRHRIVTCSFQQNGLTDMTWLVLYR